jgi:DNA-binding transcriptional LysR family regulator
VLPEDGSFTQEIVNRKAFEAAITLHRVIKMTTYPVAKEAILHGVGVGLMLHDSQYPSSQLVTRPVAELDDVFRVYLVTPSDKRELRLVRSFREVALENVTV